MSRYLLFLLLLLVSLNSVSKQIDRNQVPDPLKPWVDWVLLDEDQYQCPFFYNNFKQKNCSWPGKLSLKLQSRQGMFNSQWQVYREDWITLPGNQDYWPQNVLVNDKTALVINRKGKPSIKLTRGQYQISGVFYWQQIPESLSIPQQTGLFSLTINDKVIDYPAIKNTSVWLRQSDRGQAKPKSVENKLDIQVFRKIYGNVPLQLITYLELDVSGDQREIKLPHALLKGFIPISLKSPIPARLESDGSLLMQARPGRWHIELTARQTKEVTELGFNINDKQWPQSEIWSYQAFSHQRLVEIQNLTAIDPSQTNVPRRWRKFPAYLVNQGDKMVFKVIRRGDPEPEPNQLSLFRKLWLDFDGTAYTVTDKISGTMTRGWRLNALSETHVGQVKLNGQSQLVTSELESSKEGVEVRKGNINLQADSRIEGDISDLSAVGWEQDFYQVKTELNIPPGWRLLAASGVDNDPNSWVSRWTLLDLFLVLIAALAISRLWSIYWGVFALLVLALCWHETDAPRLIWLNILAAIALIRVLPEGKFLLFVKWYRNFCWLGLIVIIIPFLVSQVRIGLYPQLEKKYNGEQFKEQSIQPKPLLETMSMGSDAESFTPQPASVKQRSVNTFSLDSMPKRRASKPKVKTYRTIDPDANIQTGPGLPQWQWKTIHLSWNGTVDDNQTISLWYLSPFSSMLLNFLRVILVIALSCLMFDLVSNNFKFSLPKKFSFPHSCWILALVLLAAPVQNSLAAFPEQALLDDLKTRLLHAPDCIPDCASIPKMDLLIDQQYLSIKLQVIAQQSTAIPLPAQLEQWFPNQVMINGANAQAMIRSQNGGLWLSLDKGFHTLEIKGINPAQNKFSLPLPLKPHYSTLKATGWTIEGLKKNGQVDHQLVFSRQKTTAQLQSDKKQIQPGVLPAFIRIERTLHLGLDWRITTKVIRVTPNYAAVALKFPLLKDESVTTANIRVKNQQALINMAARQNSLQWESVIKKSSQINLIAANTDQWSEVWRVNTSAMWHMQTSGISVVHHQDNGLWLPEWRPWPGEKVSLNITRPKAVKGSTLTIDKSELVTKPGKRTVETVLKLSVRSSKGTQHSITLPEKVQLQSVMINGVAQPVRQKNNGVTLPVKPGKQEIQLNWRKNQTQASLLTTPTVNLAVASVNSHIKVLLGQDRWVLFTAGPKFGPAVLYWGVLIVLALLAFGLGKISLTPLQHWQWFLLLVGLSQIPLESALCVVFWLIALGLRAKKQINDSTYFNLVQICLGILTLFSMLLLFIAVQQGLLGSPDMQIAGNHSNAFNLKWYQDRTSELLPTATLISIPLMAYRVLMLLWSLWLAISLLNWLKWGWECFASGGLWKSTEKPKQSSIMEKDIKSKSDL